MHQQLTRFFHTVRHLRARQVYGQLQRHAVAVAGRSCRGATSAIPRFPGCRWSYPEAALSPAAEGLRADAVGRGEFRFLNISQEIGFPPCWERAGQSKLWQYNLHYFDWLWTLDFDSGRRVALDWMRQHPNDGARVGWEPYPTSLRLMNWCGFFFGRFRNRTENDPDFCRALWESLYLQGAWLCGHLETHLLNNHYLENAAALVVLGGCFLGKDAGRWFGKGMRILSNQVQEQILPDGAHFELSPMYHCRILYVLAVLMETGIAEVANLVAGPVGRMSDALGKLCHPDGRIALLSDSAHGIYHEPKALLRYAGRHLPSQTAGDEGYGCFCLPDAGYYGWRGPDGSYMIADFGKIGPDYAPGHGHADIFSFELSLNGHRVITDSGVYDYELSATRRYCRSTAAHNTVEIDGQDQCELWGAFRVARRGYPRDVTWHPSEKGFTLSGWHDGYRRLPGGPTHTRYMEWDRDEGLTVRDRITACRPVRTVSRLHLHPACRILDSDRHCVRVSYPGGMFCVQADAAIEVRQTPYFERFYDNQTRPCLCIPGEGHGIEQQYRVSTR